MGPSYRPYLVQVMHRSVVWLGQGRQRERNIMVEIQKLWNLYWKQLQEPAAQASRRSRKNAEPVQRVAIEAFEVQHEKIPVRLSKTREPRVQRIWVEQLNTSPQTSIRTAAGASAEHRILPVAWSGSVSEPACSCSRN